MSGLHSPSSTNLLSNGGNDTIAPDVEDADLEAGRGTAQSKRPPTSMGNQLGGSSDPAQGSNAAAQGQMNAAQREQSIWEQSAYVLQCILLVK